MFRNKSIAFKLRFFILSGIILIFSLIMYIDYEASRRILIKTAEQNATNLAMSTVNKIENVLKPVEKIPQNLAPILENSHYSENEMKRFLKAVVGKNQEVFGSCIAFEPYEYDPYKYYFGPYYYKTADSVSYKILGNKNYQYFFLDWYQIPKELNKAIWTEPYFDESGGNIIMSTYSVPFYKNIKTEKELKGIVTVDVDLTWLTSVIDSIEIIEGGYAFLISGKGTFLSYPVDTMIMNESIFSLATLFGRPDLREIGQRMINGESDFIKYEMPRNNEKKARLFFTKLPSNDWSLGIIFPEEALFADLHSLFKTLLLLGIAGIVLVFFVITLISKQITRPLENLAVVSEDIGLGNFDAVLPPIRGKDEIGKLTHSFEVMKKELKSFIINLEVTTAAKNKMESELKIAHDIQQGIIPKIFPPFPDRNDVDLFAILDPAKEVGGDLYDFFFLDEKTLVFAIGDVSGKGVPASLLMAITRTLLRAKATIDKSASRIVSEINKELCNDNENAMFVTFFLGMINLETGQVDFCNAGHNYPYILRNNARLEKIRQTHGTALGLFDSIEYKSGRITLSKTETIVLYTDGIPEAMNVNQQLLGDQALETLLDELHDNKSPKEITNALLEKTRLFASGAEQSDDITILVLTYYLNK
jgi:phosphoserine phosphatase RsbU/P